MKYILLMITLPLAASLCGTVAAQQETRLPASIEKVTLFFQGAQIQHQKSTELRAGRQVVVFEKLTDFLDPNSVQVKATGDLTILSVSTRKNFEDLKMTYSEITELNSQKKALQRKDRLLRDEYAVLTNDKNLLLKNSDLKGQETGLKVSELKDAYTFMHTQMTELTNRQTSLTRQLEVLQKEINKIEQEISTRQNKPVTNYTEVIVEIDVEKNTPAAFTFNYISPNASWKPYYDLRSDGVGQPVRLEAKALVNQTTGIEWKNIDLVLSTNDPYQNSKEPELKEWYLNYNNYPPQPYSGGRSIPVFDYSGQQLRGEAIDASTGEPLPFAKITFSNNPQVSAVTDFEGKFAITVPKGERYVSASYIGYQSIQQQINAPYLKFFLPSQKLNLQVNDIVISQQVNGALVPIGSQMQGFFSSTDTVVLSHNLLGNISIQGARSAAVSAVQKDLRVEYTIQSKLSIPSDGQDQRVQIANYTLPASYEYHAAPKLDPSVYLVAQVSGWEKLNLLNGESNLYFDGTYIGKTYVDANSTKDTLTFSLGKDSKLQVERTKIKDKSRSRSIGSREKSDIAWEIKVKNNGGALIPVVLKDQFPMSTNDDIKVKRGDFAEGKVSENSGIITWTFNIGQGQSKVLRFDYSVDYGKGGVLYLE